MHGALFHGIAGREVDRDCRDPRSAPEGKGNAKAVSINARIRVYLASISGTNISRNTDPRAAANNTLVAASVSHPRSAVRRGAGIALVPAVFVPLPCISRRVVQAERVRRIAPDR